jgi:hypothetical protein
MKNGPCKQRILTINAPQTLAKHIRAMREYAAQRSWTISLQIREVGLTAKRARREKLQDPDRRCEIDVVLVWRRNRRLGQ